MPKFIITLLLLLTCIGSVDAQTPMPVWVKQLKLSGLSGSVDHRLAVINNKTFSRGEVNDLKVAGQSLQVKCIEIGQDSVVVQIQDLAGPCVLTMSGEFVSMAPTPTTPQPAQQFAPVQQPAASPSTPASRIIFSPPVNFAKSSFKISYWVLIFFLGVGIFCLRIAATYVGNGVHGNEFKSRNSGDAAVASKDPGEAMVAETISRQFNHPHLLLNNITLPTRDGTTQIDHVLVADTGIFVIETKHYSGWIFGNAKDGQWTQTIHRKKSRFQNPLRQNYGHVKTLQSLLGLPETNFHSVVVFTGEAEFKTDLGPDVQHLSGLISFLSASRPLVFGESEMANIVGRIEMKRERRSLETDEYHINHVRQKIASKVHKNRFASSARLVPPSVSTVAVEHPDSRFMPNI